MNIFSTISALTLIASIITTIVGCTLMPTSVVNDGDRYVGDYNSYAADLQKAQFNSYGFKIVIIGSGLFCGSFIMCVCTICMCMQREEMILPARTVRINPEPQIFILRPEPIPDYDRRINNIKKWVGNNLPAQ